MTAQALSETMPALELFDGARAEGIQVIGEIYPYNYGASIVGADYLVPDNYGPNMGRDYKDIIATVVGSDAFPYTVRDTGKTAMDWDTPYEAVNGHPRGSGSHARMLALTREKKVDIPLSLAVSKMTALRVARNGRTTAARFEITYAEHYEEEFPQWRSTT